MRSLRPAPSSVFDRDGRPCLGSYRGVIGDVDLRPLGRGRLWRLAHHKQWFYVAIASEEIFVAVAIVDLGYLLNGFLLACNLRDRALVVDRTVFAPPFAGGVDATVGESGRARISFGGSHLRVGRTEGAREWEVDASVGDASLRAWIEPAGPPGIVAISEVPGGGLNTTQKQNLLCASGEAVFGNQVHRFDRAQAGFDCTNGYLARKTQWRWAFGMGRAESGEAIGINLVEGFVGEAECALWVDGDVHPLGEGRFSFDPKAPTLPWTVRSKANDSEDHVDLTFNPVGIHANRVNLGIVASRFVQPVGTFRGSIRIGGRCLEVARMAGVVEDQDVLW